MPNAPELPADLIAAVGTIDAICNRADFLFAATTLRRPAGLSLAQLLQAGMSLRQRSGIEQLERSLTQATVTQAQAPLRQHALQSLRHTQQQLLMRALAARAQGGQSEQAASQAIDSLIEQIKQFAAPPAAEATLDERVLQVWALADATRPAAE